MENIEICCSHNVGIDGKDFTPECDCSCHQPIEEKWKGSWRWRSDRMGLDKDQHDEILDFIENLLEQERQRMSEEVQKFMPADKEVNYHSSYSEGKIDMAEKILSIINK
mgnify:CR=1 FL=1